MMKTKKILLNVLCVALVFSAMAFSMTGCGRKQKDDENEVNDVEDSFSGLHHEDEESGKAQESENTLRGKCFLVEEDGSLVIIDDDMEFVWYQDASDRSINYFGGPCEVYYGEEAYDYITNDYAEGGVYREKSVFNFSEEKMQIFFDAAEDELVYSKANMICMILHHENMVVEDEYQEKLDNADESNIDTYYWGFYDGEIFYCYNIESGDLMTWTPADGYEAEEDDVQGDEPRDDDSEIESLRAGDSCDIMVGSETITIDVPLDAEYAYSGTCSLTYDLGSINVEYKDSYCELTEDAIEDLTDWYDIWASRSDTLSDIKPVETKVGDRDAYYCRTVDSADIACYIFYVDIGKENYLHVTLLGPADELSEKRAFELADLEFR